MIKPIPISIDTSWMTASVQSKRYDQRYFLDGWMCLKVGIYPPDVLVCNSVVVVATPNSAVTGVLDLRVFVTSLLIFVSFGTSCNII